MSNDKSSWIAGLSDDFNYVKHNKTDFEGFKQFQSSVEEKFELIEKKRRRAERIANLEKWDKSLPDRWVEARFNKIEKPVMAKITAALKRNARQSFFLTGASGSGKTFVAYAIARRFIGHGVVSTSQVRIVSEQVLLNQASRGFKGQDDFNELLNPKTKLFVFDGIGALSDKEADQVAGFWEQIIDHVYSKDLMVIFTSADSLDRFTSSLSPSGESKLRTLVEHGQFEVESTGSKSAK